MYLSTLFMCLLYLCVSTFGRAAWNYFLCCGNRNSVLHGILVIAAMKSCGGTKNLKLFFINFQWSISLGLYNLG